MRSSITDGLPNQDDFQSIQVALINSRDLVLSNKKLGCIVHVMFVNVYTVRIFIVSLVCMYIYINIPWLGPVDCGVIVGREQ